MCGIIGYIGKREAIPILLEGLRKLEYRGYDSAGIAIIEEGKIKETKSVGKLDRLEEIVAMESFKGKIGIGHTRWATHGAPSDINAHPHSDCKREIAVVHNGIIENYIDLKEWLTKEGHHFRSETDTEIIAHLIEFFYETTLFEAVKRAIQKLSGSYAFCVISSREPQKIIAVRYQSPLVIGLGDGENFIASDIPAFLRHTRNALLIEDNEIVVVTEKEATIYNDEGKPKSRNAFLINWSAQMAEKGGYPHFMLKEIFEQPRVLVDTYREKITKENEVEFKELNPFIPLLQTVDRIFIVACGTAYHAGLVGKYFIEAWAEVPVEVDYSSEFRYRHLIANHNTLLIAVSQSGETADTLAAVRKAKELGLTTISINNVLGSTMSREVDCVIYTRAGLEIGVAATKTFIAQLEVLAMFALYLGKVRGRLAEETEKLLIEEIKMIPRKVDWILENHEEIEKIAYKYYNVFNFLYLGRHLNYPIALEGALKLKEISYIHAEGYAAGEMKHGPIALIEDKLPVVVLLPEGPLYDKMLNNLKEVEARRGIPIVITTQGNREIRETVKEVIYIPECNYWLSPFLTIIPLQLLAYYISKIKGCDVDQPRNLAKSVTVE